MSYGSLAGWLRSSVAAGPLDTAALRVLRRPARGVVHRCNSALVQTERDSVPPRGISRSNFAYRDGRGILPWLSTRRFTPLRMTFGAAGGLRSLYTPGGPHSCSDNPGLLSSTPFGVGEPVAVPDSTGFEIYKIPVPRIASRTLG